MRRDDNTVIQTIRIEPRALTTLLKELRNEEKNDGSNSGRVHDRVWMSKRVLVAFNGKSARSTQYEAMVRNISTRGMSFVLGLYIYPESDCTITIHTYTGQVQTITGVVRRCRHIAGTVHEIGVEFDAEIELEKFIKPSSIAATEASANELRHAEGRVLIIEDNELDKRLVENALSDSRLEFMHAIDGEAAIEYAKQNPTLIICDQNLPDTKGVKLIGQIRDSGYEGRFIMVTGEENEELRNSAKQAGVSGFVVKPWSPSELRALVSESLTESGQSAPGGGQPIFSTADPEQIPADLVVAFVNDLKEICASTEAAIDPLDRDSLRGLSIKVKGSALSCGFAPLTHAAGRLLHAIDEQENDTAISAAAKKMVSVCRRAAVPESWKKAA